MKYVECQYIEFEGENITIDISGFTGNWFKIVMDGCETDWFNSFTTKIPVKRCMNGQWPNVPDITCNGTQIEIERLYNLHNYGLVIINAQDDDKKDFPRTRKEYVDCSSGVTSMTIAGNTGRNTVETTLESRQNNTVTYKAGQSLTETENAYIVYVSMDDFHGNCMTPCTIGGENNDEITFPFILECYE